METYGVMLKLTLKPARAALGAWGTSCNPAARVYMEENGAGTLAPVRPRPRPCSLFPKEKLLALAGTDRSGWGIWKGLRPPSPQIILF